MQEKPKTNVKRQLCNNICNQSMFERVLDEVHKNLFMPNPTINSDSNSQICKTNIYVVFSILEMPKNSWAQIISCTAIQCHEVFDIKKQRLTKRKSVINKPLRCIVCFWVCQGFTWGWSAIDLEDESRRSEQCLHLLRFRPHFWIYHILCSFSLCTVQVVCRDSDVFLFFVFFQSEKSSGWGSGRQVEQGGAERVRGQSYTATQRLQLWTRHKTCHAWISLLL